MILTELLKSQKVNSLQHKNTEALNKELTRQPLLTIQKISRHYQGKLQKIFFQKKTTEVERSHLTQASKQSLVYSWIVN